VSYNKKIFRNSASGREYGISTVENVYACCENWGRGGITPNWPGRVEGVKSLKIRFQKLV